MTPCHRRRAVSIIAAAAAPFLVISATSSADIIKLKDGTTLEGDVKRAPDGGWTVVTVDGQTRTVARADVKSIEATTATHPSTGPSAAAAADENLYSLRRSVENIDDAAVAIDKYERFLEANPAAPAAEPARADLATWRDRRDRGLVKVGGEWVTPDARADRQTRAIALASQARQQIKGGHPRDAERTLRQALEVDPRNPSAWYLRGVLAHQADRAPEARKAFEQVNAAIPNHAPTLNNLGVVLFRQRQYGGAMTYYDQAMQASPVDREILDNVAEAIEALDDGQESSTAAQKAIRRFRSQDKELQDRLAKQGLYRWGATWVTQAQLEQLREAERRIQETLDRMAATYDAEQDAIVEIDADIATNERAMRQIEASRYVRDPYAGTRRGAYPAVYYELDRDTDKLRRDRAAHVARQEELRAAAKAARKDVPVPRYTGVQKLIETEGTPIAVPESGPTTAPAVPAAATRGMD
jgi:Tfp pilus assembly protein PilF